ncbi:replication endonuclease [Pseudomonas iridis]|uniref:replication endonuclease n=1 Tax=Pseudomonas iridis TaxID=2710587 RepID=UPI0038175940
MSVGAIKRSTTLGRLRRLRSQQFWLSSLNRILDAARESQARRAGLLGCVDQGKMPYCSNATIEILKAREQEIIRRVAQSPRKNLAEIYKNSEKSTFNKAYLQAKAMDIVANKRGMNWLFVTLTCPPEYHCNALSFDGSSFDDCQRYLKKVFAQIGRAIANAGYRSGTDYHGTRVLELHKDGTPHWHVLYYYTGDLDKVVEKNCPLSILASVIDRKTTL